MRFVSKQQNLTVILKPSFPGNHLTGTAPVSGVSAKFQYGILEVKDEAIIDMLKKHPAYNVDYISVEDSEADPFMYLRNESEPAHVIQEINYGHVEKSMGNKNPVKLSPEIRKALQDEAMEMAKKMLPSMLEEAMKGLISEHQNSKIEEDATEEKSEVKTKDVSPIKNKKASKEETNVKIEDTKEEQ